MATGGGGDTYAGKVGRATTKRKKLNILDIFLERKDNTISFNLNKEELSKLLFKKMKMDPKTVIKVDTSAFRTIHVEFNPNVGLESFAELPAFEIRDGLRTKFFRPHHRKDTLVTISWLDLETPDGLINHVFSHFGAMKSNVQWCKIKPENEESEEAKLLNNILSGERQFWIELDRPLKSYASVDQRKVKIFHLGQKRTCARCQKDGENCPGRANAKSCEENGEEKTNVEVAWKTILNTVAYTEWTGGEVSAGNPSNEEESNEPVVQDEAEPIEGCVGLVIDNLEEDATNEDVKTILKKACSEDILNTCSIHPSGSLRSKIVKFPNTDIIPSIAKKVDQKSFRGRMVYCKAFVPKTPPKENKTAASEETSNSPNKDNSSGKVNGSPTSASAEQAIPGLPEEDRVKALKSKVKEKKEKKSKKKESKESLDIKNLSQKDFLISNGKGETSDDAHDQFKFSDDDSESDADEIEDVKDVDAEEADAFATPIQYKSSFGRNVARSESRARSRSVLIKRSSSDDADEGKDRKKKSMKSGLPTPRNHSSNK